ncbi:hypothetical protein KJ786_02655 [Patescibacteria group bacterium]|nr:hypothetical protein [Patescibacteria group bacterium]
MIWLYLLIFIASCLALPWLGSILVDSLIKIAKFLKWREFIVAFFVMAFATSIPNLFVDISAVLHGLPQLAFGDILGGNMVDLSLVLALAVFLTHGNLSTGSRMVQTSALFTTAIVLLPLLLISDGNLSRGDGLVLIFAFLFYTFWIFSKEDRFKKIYDNKERKSIAGVIDFFKSLLKIVFLLGMLLLASEGIIKSAQFFSISFNIPLSIIGILIVGLANCFPEIYFIFISAKKNQNWMILGDIMGSVIVCATLVLGIVALVSPFEIKDFSPFITARIFTVIAAFFFLLVVKTGQKITKKEGLFLLFLYIAFLITEIFLR